MIFSRRFQAGDGTVRIFIEDAVYILLRKDGPACFAHQVFLQADNIGISAGNVIKNRMLGRIFTPLLGKPLYIVGQYLQCLCRRFNGGKMYREEGGDGLVTQDDGDQ